MDKQAWQATVHGVAKSGTQLEGLSVQSQEIILPKKKKLNIFLIFLKKEKALRLSVVTTLACKAF